MKVQFMWEHTLQEDFWLNREIPCIIEFKDLEALDRQLISWEKIDQNFITYFTVLS